MKIGFTERGDGGRNLDWIAACKNRKVDGAVIVTKTLTASCGYGMLELHNEGFPPDSARHHHRLGRHAYGTACI